MRILRRHISAAVISMTLLVTLMLGALLAFINYLTELKDIGTLHYGVWQAFVFVTLSLPHDLYPFFPIAALIGCLIALGQLASHSELVVMRAAGISKLQITGAVIRATLVMLLVATLIGEVFAPPLESYAAAYKTSARTGSDPSTWGRSGFWLRSGTNFIHIDHADPSGALHGVTRYQFDDAQKLELASHAQTAKLAEGDWVFQQVAETRFIPERVVARADAQQLWSVRIDPQWVSAAEVNSAQASLRALYRFIHYLRSSGLAANSYQFDFWTRILQPLLTVVMIALAVPVIFGPLRSVTMGFRVLVGVVLGFGFYTINAFLGPFSLVYAIPPFWAAAAPLLLIGIVDAVLLWRNK